MYQICFGRCFVIFQPHKMANGTMCEVCIFQLKGHNQGHIPFVQNDPLSWRFIFNHEGVTLCNNSKFNYLIFVVNCRTLIPMNIQLNALNFDLKVIVSTFLTLVAPMIITSIQTAANDPGLPLGLTYLPPGCKRKTFQILMSIFFPFTILLLRLQHQIVQKKRERILELQNPYLIREFNRLSPLLQKMDEHKKKMVKIDIAFEIAHQMFINLVLVLFSTSETRYIFIR